MAKGQILKKEISKKILSIFPNSFLYNNGKEIRINGVEEGENLQIKISLTCTKDAVIPGNDVKLPGEENIITPITISKNEINFDNQPITSEPTLEEKQNVADLLASLGL